MAESMNAAATAREVDPAADPRLDDALYRLEARHEQLYAELKAVEARLRELRTAADLCPECGGSGERWVRGGIYGELQRRPCVCQSR